MKRLTILAAVLALTGAITASAGAHTSTYFGFQIGIGNAPPPPAFVYRGPPPTYFEPETRVYVVESGYDNCDVFRYGSFWYANNEDGYWYRARSYRGPFVTIDVRSVPRPIFYVPQRRWHHYPQRLQYWHQQQAYGHPGHRHDRGWQDDRGRDRHDNGRRGDDGNRGRGHGGGRD